MFWIGWISTKAVFPEDTADVCPLWLMSVHQMETSMIGAVSFQ